jgi:hypothetical protein
MGGLMIIRRKLPQTPKPPLPKHLRAELFAFLDWIEQLCSTGYAWLYQDSDGDWCYGVEIHGGSEKAENLPEYDPDYDPNDREISDFENMDLYPTIAYSLCDYEFKCGYDYDKNEELPSRHSVFTGYYPSSINAAISEWRTKRDKEYAAAIDGLGVVKSKG